MEGRRSVVLGVALAALACWPAAAGAAELAVTTTEDAVDVAPGDGTCDTGAGCSLRAAVQEANAAGGATTIAVPAGRYVLRIAPFPQAGSMLDSDAANGDLDLGADITVAGAGAGRTIIDGGGVDRVFDTGRSADAVLRDLTVTGGDATAGDSQEINLGGGVLVKSGMTLDRVALVGNKADGGGGMFSIPLTNPTVRDSLIAGNEAFEGGGLRVDSGATIVNTTITGNRLRAFDPADLARKPVGIVIPVVDEISGYGGGIDHRGGSLLTIVSSTITGNHAIKGGGGLGAGQAYTPISEDLPLGHVELRGTIIAGNSSDAGAADCRTNQVRFVSLGHNLSGDASCFFTAAGDQARTDPRLGPLAGHGGPTPTHALLDGSPALDAGPAQGCPPVDQRGTARPQGAACDIGAFEAVPVTAAPCARKVVRLSSRMRRRARSYDVVAGRALLARRVRPSATVRVGLRRTRVVLRVHLRSGRAVRFSARPTCRAS